VPVPVRLHRAPAVRVSIAVLALASAAVMSFGSRPAHAANVSCGDTITTDTKLHQDLVNCPNVGILVGADNVTLNLNGHTIDGDGAPTPGCDPNVAFCDIGVATEGQRGLTVKSGSVRDFEAGVVTFDTRRTRLLRISTPRNHLSGFALASSNRILVRNSSGDRTTDPEGNGLGIFFCSHIRVLHSSFRGNVHAGIKPVGSTNGLIKGNVLARNGDEGMLVEDGDRFRVKHNRFVRNGGGITLGPGSGNVITLNRLSRVGDGIRIEKGHDNLVARNVVVHARHAGIRLGIKHPLLGGAHNVVRRNVVRDSRVDGYLVGKKERHSFLIGNVATGAGDDGFDIEGRMTTLTSNRAVRNGDLGISAVRGVNDGGGNIARHNGDPRECTNIVCN
jgi:nitrous oxidase accessory protein NosD